MSKYAHKLKFQIWKVSVRVYYSQQNSNSKTRFSTWSKFHDFIDRSGFSTKYKTKDEYSLIMGK